MIKYNESCQEKENCQKSKKFLLDKYKNITSKDASNAS